MAQSFCILSFPRTSPAYLRLLNPWGIPLHISIASSMHFTVSMRSCIFFCWASLRSVLLLVKSLFCIFCAFVFVFGFFFFSTAIHSGTCSYTRRFIKTDNAESVCSMSWCQGDVLLMFLLLPPASRLFWLFKACLGWQQIEGHRRP